jgi:nucleoside-diphosphate kinase
MQIPQDLARRLYYAHINKTFYEGLVKFVTSAPSLLMVWEAEGIIETARKMMGTTFVAEAQPGTLRGDFSCAQGYNLIHGSDSPQSAAREIEIFFKPQEIINYQFADAA